ncbi:C-1-tetrahydrofolate synthase [Sarcoptes scabiei]|nr:C-1-tetrahydrofolate synthase [Sarcoptes scabiei]
METNFVLLSNTTTESVAKTSTPLNDIVQYPIVDNNDRCYESQSFECDPNHHHHHQQQEHQHRHNHSHHLANVVVSDQCSLQTTSTTMAQRIHFGPLRSLATACLLPNVIDCSPSMTPPSILSNNSSSSPISSSLLNSDSIFVNSNDCQSSLTSSTSPLPQQSSMIINEFTSVISENYPPTSNLDNLDSTHSTSTSPTISVPSAQQCSTSKATAAVIYKPVRSLIEYWPNNDHHHYHPHLHQHQHHQNQQQYLPQCTMESRIPSVSISDYQTLQNSSAVRYSPSHKSIIDDRKDFDQQSNSERNHLHHHHQHFHQLHNQMISSIPMSLADAMISKSSSSDSDTNDSGTRLISDSSLHDISSASSNIIINNPYANNNSNHVFLSNLSTNNSASLRYQSPSIDTILENDQELPSIDRNDTIDCVQSLNDDNRAVVPTEWIDHKVIGENLRRKFLEQNQTKLFDRKICTDSSQRSMRKRKFQFHHFNFGLWRFVCPPSHRFIIGSMMSLIVGIVLIATALGLLYSVHRKFRQQWFDDFDYNNRRYRFEEDRFWYHRTTFYEIFVASFKDSDGDGFGDFQGIIDQSEYLRNLGIHAIRIDSILAAFDYPNDCDGVVNFYDVDHHLGTFDQFIQMIKTLHSKRIRVIVEMDLTATSHQHHWSMNGSDEYRHYYVDSSPKISGKNSNQKIKTQRNQNRSISKQNRRVLNWNHQPLREKMLNVVDFWLKYVDGLYLKGFEKIHIDPEESDDSGGGGGDRDKDGEREEILQNSNRFQNDDRYKSMSSIIESKWQRREKILIDFLQKLHTIIENREREFASIQGIAIDKVPKKILIGSDRLLKLWLQRNRRMMMMMMKTKRRRQTILEENSKIFDQKLDDSDHHHHHQYQYRNYTKNFNELDFDDGFIPIDGSRTINHHLNHHLIDDHNQSFYRSISDFLQLPLMTIKTSKNMETKTPTLRTSFPSSLSLSSMVVNVTIDSDMNQTQSAFGHRSSKNGTRLIQKRKDHQHHHHQQHHHHRDHNRLQPILFHYFDLIHFELQIEPDRIDSIREQVNFVWQENLKIRFSELSDQNVGDDFDQNYADDIDDIDDVYDQKDFPTLMWSFSNDGSKSSSRIASVLGSKYSLASHFLLAMMPGTISVLYGDEIGLKDFRFKKIASKNRIELMSWSEEPPNGNFSYPNSTTWIPVDESYNQINVEKRSEWIKMISDLILFRLDYLHKERDWRRDRLWYRNQESSHSKSIDNLSKSSRKSSAEFQSKQSNHQSNSLMESNNFLFHYIDKSIVVFEQYIDHLVDIDSLDEEHRQRSSSLSSTSTSLLSSSSSMSLSEKTLIRQRYVLFVNLGNESVWEDFSDKFYYSEIKLATNFNRTKEFLIMKSLRLDPGEAMIVTVE